MVYDWTNIQSQTGMLKILFDQNFNHRIIRGLAKRISNFDFETTQSLNRENEKDPKLLELASEMKRVTAAHDFETFPAFAYQKMSKGENIFGVVWIPADMPIGNAVDELEIVIICSEENEYENRVEYLPLGLT